VADIRATGLRSVVFIASYTGQFDLSVAGGFDGTLEIAADPLPLVLHPMDVLVEPVEDHERDPVCIRRTL
jgi:hypothetical protein